MDKSVRLRRTGLEEIAPCQLTLALAVVRRREVVLAWWLSSLDKCVSDCRLD